MARTTLSLGLPTFMPSITRLTVGNSVRYGGLSEVDGLHAFTRSAISERGLGDCTRNCPFISSFTKQKSWPFCFWHWNTVMATPPLQSQRVFCKSAGCGAPGSAAGAGLPLTLQVAIWFATCDRTL